MVRSELRSSFEVLFGFPRGGVYSGRSNRFNRFHALEASDEEEELEVDTTWLFSSLDACSVASFEESDAAVDDVQTEFEEADLEDECRHADSGSDELSDDCEFSELSLLLDDELWAHGKGCSFYQAELFSELFFSHEEQFGLGACVDEEKDEYLSIDPLDESEDGIFFDISEEEMDEVSSVAWFKEDEIEGIIEEMLTRFPRGGALGSATTAKKRQIQQLLDLIGEWGNSVPDTQDTQDTVDIGKMALSLRWMGKRGPRRRASLDLLLAFINSPFMKQ